MTAEGVAAPGPGNAGASGNVFRCEGRDSSVVWWHVGPMYFLFILPGLVLSLIASFLTKSAFSKYSQVRTATGLTGAQAAKRLLDGAGIHDVEIVGVPGSLTDHYDPSRK